MQGSKSSPTYAKLRWRNRTEQSGICFKHQNSKYKLWTNGSLMDYTSLYTHKITLHAIVFSQYRQKSSWNEVTLYNNTFGIAPKLSIAMSLICIWLWPDFKIRGCIPILEQCRSKKPESIKHAETFMTAWLAMQSCNEDMKKTTGKIINFNMHEL